MNVIPSPSRADLTPFEAAVDKLETAIAAPTVLQRLLSMLADPDVSWVTIEDALKVDGGLVARVLRMASSPAFAARPVRGLGVALQTLGCDEVRRLVVAAYFSGRGSPFARSLWDYALRVAFTTAALARLSRRIVLTADPFLCGLLHDVGTVAMESILGGRYTGAGFAPGDDRQLAIERELFGFDHTDLGAMVASRWNLFPELELVAQLHHDPGACELIAVPDATRNAIELVALARVVGREPSDPAREQRDAGCARLGIDPETAEACATVAARQTSQLFRAVNA